MADETSPDTTPQQRAPVRMGLRVVARHSAGRHGGRALAREVVEAHRPKLLDSSTRLARPPPAPPAAAPGGGGYQPPAPPPAPAPPAGPEFFAPDFATPTAAFPGPSSSGVIA